MGNLNVLHKKEDNILWRHSHQDLTPQHNTLHTLTNPDPLHIEFVKLS